MSLYNQIKDYKNIPSLKEFQKYPGYPSLHRIKKGAVACIECIQEIPCDPCVASCPFKAISINPHITNLPYLNEKKCKGCGTCISSCPGQAIFVLEICYSSDKAAISFPYEYLPYPNIGEVVMGVNRKGEPVVEVEIVKVEIRNSFDKTGVITIACDKEYIHHIRFIERIKKDAKKK